MGLIHRMSPSERRHSYLIAIVGKLRLATVFGMDHEPTVVAMPFCSETTASDTAYVWNYQISRRIWGHGLLHDPGYQPKELVPCARLIAGLANVGSWPTFEEPSSVEALRSHMRECPGWYWER